MSAGVSCIRRGYRWQPRVLVGVTCLLHRRPKVSVMRRQVMSTDIRTNPNERGRGDELAAEHALRWLRSRLAWEQLLVALREAGDPDRAESAPRTKPAAA